jgi:hypothetical protein
MNMNLRQSPPNESEQEVESLRNENEQLKAKVAQLEAIVGTQSKVAKWLANLGIRVSLGTNLNDSIYELIHAWRSKGWPEDREVANVIAALLRRWLRIGLIAMLGGAGAVVTVGLLLWQNFLIQEQIQLQAEVSNATRRAELISTIYDKLDCGAENPDECSPAASLRARTEAAVAFIKLEDTLPNLSSANLSGANLSDANLFGANLWDANLFGANLSMANLSGANLGEANLFGADLIVADLTEATLSGADLTGANLTGANLGEADLSWANLSDANLCGADLTGANLWEADLSGVKYTLGTIWPEGFDYVGLGASLVNEDGQLLEPPSPTATPPLDDKC